jgi:Mg2+ and Co2+ transporter CorA
MAVASFARDVRTRLATLDVVLDDIDEALSEPRDPDRLSNLGGRLGAVRREATRIRRALTPLARALHEDAEDLPEWTGLAEPGAAHRSLHTALDDLAALAERTRQLQDELTTRLTEETNRRLYFVSIVTTLFMPATFITGFFGMNTGGLPWGGDEAHHGTFFATLLCLGAVGAAIMLLRRKRLF